MRKIWLLFLLVFFMAPKIVLGVENKSTYISPPFADIEISNKEDKVIELEIGNNGETDLVFELSVVDFGSLDESGGVAFLTTNQDKGERKYALASWISLEKSEVVVAAKSKEKIKITILNKESLLPGGHYGAVLATLRNEEKSDGDKVGLNQSMATLLYVQKSGDEKRNLVLRNIIWQNPTLKFIDLIDLRFENNGNTHLVPRGKVEIKNIFNKAVAEGIINEGSVKILPETFRKMMTQVNYFKKWKWPGKYLIEIDYRYDGKEAFSKYNNSFLYVGVEGIILLLFGLILGLLTVQRKKKVF